MEERPQTSSAGFGKTKSQALNDIIKGQCEKKRRARIISSIYFEMKLRIKLSSEFQILFC